jgi:transcription initiation factor TFIIB
MQEHDCRTISSRLLRVISMTSNAIATSVADESVDKQSERPACPECHGQLTTTDTETVCDDCGLVVAEDHLDPGPEWRSFNDDETAAVRTGAPLTATRHDRGLSTEIGWHRDANGTPLSASKRRQLARLRQKHTRSQWRSKAEYNLAYGLGEVQRIASSLDLAESIREQACALFRTAHGDGLAFGRSLDTIAAASVHAACRCNGLARAIEEVEAATNCDHSSLWNAYTTLNDELELPTQPLCPHAVLPQLLAACNVPPSVHETAHELARCAEKTGLANGPSPRSVAGGCILLALNEQSGTLTQDDLATVANVTPNTLRKHRDRLRDRLDLPPQD